VADMMAGEILKALTFAVRLLVQVVIPAIFGLALFISQQFMGWLQRCWPQMPAGMVVLIATAAWSIVGVLVSPLLITGTQTPAESVGLGLIAGAVLGVCVGSRLAQEWMPHLPMQQIANDWGIPEHALEIEEEEEAIPIDQLWNEGVILGQDLNQQP